MIADRLDNWPRALDQLSFVVDFLKNLSPNTLDGDVELRGRDVFVRIMSYVTKPRQDLRLETHQEYVDVQTVLAGEEILAWHPASELNAATPYDHLTDAVFYQTPAQPCGSIRIKPGRFVIFFPSDGHGAHAVEMPIPIRKVVVKVRVNLFDLTSK